MNSKRWICFISLIAFPISNPSSFLDERARVFTNKRISVYVYAGSVIVCSKEIERERRARSHRKGGNNGGGGCGGFGPSLSSSRRFSFFFVPIRVPWRWRDRLKKQTLDPVFTAFVPLFFSYSQLDLSCPDWFFGIGEPNEINQTINHNSLREFRLIWRDLERIHN